MSKKLIDDSRNRRLTRQDEKPVIDVEYFEEEPRETAKKKKSQKGVHWEIYVIIALLAILGVQGGFLLGRLSVPTQQSAASSAQIFSEPAPAVNEEIQNFTEAASEAAAAETPKPKEEQAASPTAAVSDTSSVVLYSENASYSEAASPLEEPSPLESNDGYIGVTAADFDYQETAAGSGIVINRYHGMETDVIIPDTIDGLPVVEIGDGAFKSIDIESVVFPSNLKTVGEEAFRGCHSLESVTMNASLTALGKEAFFGCRSLTSIELPDSVKDIPGYTFFNCKSLSYVKLPEKLESIGSSAFSGCEELSSIEFPRTLEMINTFAFKDTRLSSVIIPADCKDRTKAFDRGVDVKRLG